MTNDVLDKLTFEEAMRELEKLVDSLDKGEVSLDEAIAAYDRGSQLKDYCQKKYQKPPEYSVFKNNSIFNIYKK